LGHNEGGGWAGYFEGPVFVTGKLTKFGGGFRIDNPADPANSYLDHSWVESNDMMNVYNGNTTTDDDGNATVELPGYFEALNRDFRYQLTVVGQFATAIVAEEVRDNRFRIKTDKPNVMVSWQVTGIRQDVWANAIRIEVEVQKTEAERGKYLHPEEHGQPATAGIIQIELPVAEETELDSGQLQGE
jgi:trimeric autotransporter adhesin